MILERISDAHLTCFSVSLPDGFCVAEGAYGESLIYRGNEHYELGTNKDEEPVIIDRRFFAVRLPASASPPYPTPPPLGQRKHGIVW